MTGRVVSAETGAPIADAVVTVTSPSLQGGEVAVTDAGGFYRLQGLPPGEYAVRLEREGFRPLVRPDVEIRAGSTIQLDLQALPEVIRGERIVVTAEAPTVDVGSSAAGMTIDQPFVRRVPVAPPGGRGAGVRSIESVAEVAPGAQADLYGTSVNGASSPENLYLVDGMSAGDPAFGILALPLSIEFVEEMNVVTAGYMPEYGRAPGGVLDVVTKSGSNEFSGSVFHYFTPGALQGERARLAGRGQTITVDPSLSFIHAFGAELGGPILKDRLWFYLGIQVATTRYRVDRELHRLRLDEAGAPVPRDGAFETEPIPGTRRAYPATERSLQYVGKLTYRVARDHRVSLSAIGTPAFSGGDGEFGIHHQQGVPETQVYDPIGAPSAVQHRYATVANRLVLNYAASSPKKSWLFDGMAGWQRGRTAQLPRDGSKPGDDEGLAALPRVEWRRSIPGFHGVEEFERVPNGACTPPPGSTLSTLCPVPTYQGGGPDFIEDSTLDRFQARGVVTRLVRGAGRHVVKAGVDFQLTTYDRVKAFSGSRRYFEGDDGSFFIDGRQFGYLLGPDDPVILEVEEARSSSVVAGAFVQDSYSPLRGLVLNAGLRYDSQLLYGSDGDLGLALPNQWSPRAGVVFDPTRKGRAKLYGSYAIYYETVPLDVVDRALPAERMIASLHDASTCDPRRPGDRSGSCLSDENRIPFTSPSDPNRKWYVQGSDKVPVDPDIDPQSSSEIVLGGELEVVKRGRLGLRYIRRWVNQIVEDMSRDEGQTYFIGNPGSGIASDFPEAVRDYDAGQLYFERHFSDGWLAFGSYTLSYLRGNWSGLFRPETGQLDPNYTSDFDLVSLLPNREGPLPGDRTHQFKVFGAKAFPLPGGHEVELGLGYRGRSGAPTNYLGAHPLYGQDEVFILERGSGPRLPWVHDVDARVGFGVRLSKESVLSIGIDVFNIFNFQAATRVDETFTAASVLPVSGGRSDADLDGLRTSDGSAFDPGQRNPNFGRPIAFQAPRTLRFSTRVTF